nr:phosphomannomutase/phosphoglucomutase [Pleionea sp. CnH1-48]
MGSKSILSLGGPYIIFSCLIICLVAILLYYVVVSGPSAQKNQIFTQGALRGYVDSILVKVETARDYVDQFANSSPVVAAVIDQDLQRIQELEQQLNNRIPYTMGVKILFPTVMTENLSSKPPITNVVLDLVRDVVKGKPVHPEVIKPGSNDSFVSIMSPVKSGDRVLAVVVLALERQLIDDTLERIHSVPGYIELQQNFYNKEQMVGSQGDASLKSGRPFAVGTRPGSNWSVAFWPKDLDGFSGRTELIYFILGVITILVVVGVCNFIGLRTLQYDVKADTGHLAKLLLDTKGQFIDTSGSFKINFFRDLIVTLVRNGFSVGIEPSAHEPAAVKTKPAMNEAPVEDNRPLIASLGSDDGLEVQDHTPMVSLKIPESIFRAYDIRGVVNETLTPEIVKEIGRAIGSEAFERGEQKVVVARDGRLSGPSLTDALKEGLIESGRDVIDIGMVPTPILYFATNYLDTRSGVMVTGSHNPANYNGLKVVIAGETLSKENIQALRKRIVNDEFVSGQGSEEVLDLLPDYLGQITSDVALAQPLKVAVDCGNGVSGGVIPQLLQALGCEVIGLYCDVDGNFPNHHPDPSKPENLKDLINMVKNEEADLGLAFDGDGDRLGVIASDGTIIWPDRQMMLYAIDVLSRNPGADIIFDVKCTSHLPKVISSHGGRPIMWKTGHSLIKAKMRETGALLAGECSGHIFFKERWFGFDDALYTAARLLEILAGDVRKSAEVFAALPDSVVTPEINVSISDARKFTFIKKLSENAHFPGGKLNTIDGIRVDYDDGWGLVRASNTTPCLVVRFEAENEDALHRIQDTFRQQVLAIDSSLQLPF